jgi:alpha-mannosidase
MFLDNEAVSIWLENIKIGRYSVIQPLNINAWHTKEPVAFNDRETGEHKTLKVGDSWGELFDCAWFLLSTKVPAGIESSVELGLQLDVNGEILVYDDNGDPHQGLTNGSSVFDRTLGLPGKTIYRLPKPLYAGDNIEIWADAGCNDLFGVRQADGVIVQADLVSLNQAIIEFYEDASFLVDALDCFPKDSARYYEISQALHCAMEHTSNLDLVAIELASTYLKVCLQQKNSQQSLIISAIGHAHIDLAWLWPVRETLRKGGRTFATALRNMEHDDNYVFGASQPQLYQWIKERYPSIYQQISERIKEGRWEVQGGMWVEPDTNVPSGESLIRQLVYGKRFFQDEFGIDVEHLWLPDAFGFSPVIPQLLKLCGINYFMTMKLAWNSVNRFPYHSFVWEGQDGSQVLSHILPEETYNSPAQPQSVAKIFTNYAERDISVHALMTFGIGDGGGGPGEEHLNRVERLRDFAGLPKVIQESSLSFFRKLAQETDKLPTWKGELYLEKHQGTLTSVGFIKKFNRKMELDLFNSELLAVMCQCLVDDFQATNLDDVWKETLLNQFHDILPGSSIARVYDEARERYQVLTESVGCATKSALTSIENSINTEMFINPVLVMNTLAFARDEWVKLGQSWQKIEVPSIGYAVFSNTQEYSASKELIVDENRIDNGILSLTITDDGLISSIYDVENECEVLSEGEHANVLAVYADDGDAWDFPPGYRDSGFESPKLIKKEVFRDGPIIGIKLEFEYRQSTIKQKVQLMQGGRRIDFITHLNWQEPLCMLRVSFPVSVTADEASYATQFGYKSYSTKNTTSWDEARDEVAAYPWVDLSDGDYGVALMSDCKYGYRVKGHLLDLNLLRTPPYPAAFINKDDVAVTGEGYSDLEEHHFSYALYPHSGNLVAAKVREQAEKLINPLSVTALESANQGYLEPMFSFVDIDSSHITISAVKNADRSEGIILRLVEVDGCDTLATVKFPFDVMCAKVTDLLENPIENLECMENSIVLKFKPFEIKTLLVQLSNA